MGKETKLEDYILDIFAVEHHKDSSYVLGFGFKENEADGYFKRENFQLKIEKDCTLKELCNKMLYIAMAMKEKMEKEIDILTNE